MNKIYRLPLLFSGFAFIYFCTMWWLGDLIPINAYLGFDGINSAKISQDVYNQLIETKQGAYTFQKSFLWFVLGGIYWVISQFSSDFAASLTTNDIVSLKIPANTTIALVSWTIVNSLCILIALLLWAKLLNRFSITGRTVLLSYFLLVVNLSNFRMSAFYVTISDLLLFTFGVGVLHLYFATKQKQLVVFGFFSGFVRSGMNFLVAIFALFPYDPNRAIKDKNIESPLGFVAAGIAGTILAAGLTYYGLYKQESWVQPGMISARWLTALLILLPIIFGYYYLFKSLQLSEFIPKLKNVLWAAAIIVAVFIVIKNMAGPNDLPYLEFYRRSLLTALIYPGITMVSHIIYFGPGVLLLVFLWPRVTQVAREFGVGFVLFVALGLALSIMPESRTITHFIPAFFLALTIALSRMEARLPKWGYFAVPLLCLLFSKFWLFLRWPEGPVNHYTFPEQLYFMNMGPWMSGESMIMQGLASVIASIILLAWIYDFRPIHRHLPEMEN